MAKVLTDFHHSSLLRATNLLFGDRLGMEVFRPIGMEWYEHGYWALNDQLDTARQYLEEASQPLDNTPRLNDPAKKTEFVEGTCRIMDPGNLSFHRACTLDYFKANEFDYVIASIPQHVPLFKALIKEFMPNAKLIIQMGNNWDIEQYAGMNVLASIAPTLTNANAVFYHQEIESVFKPRVTHSSKKIYSFVNILQNTGQGWNDFEELEKLLPEYSFKSYGGQCRDGNMNGPLEIANAMHEAEFILHSKPGGDGFGHVIFSAYACGRPVIARPSQYKGQLAEQLLVPGTFIDLDKYGRGETKNMIRRITCDPDMLFQMGKRAGERFAEVVDYEKEALDVAEWLKTLR